jgi:hypothetical protein
MNHLRQALSVVAFIAALSLLGSPALFGAGSAWAQPCDGQCPGSLIPASKDSVLRSANPNFNEGANPRLMISGNGGRRIVVGFDLDGVPTGSVTSAILVLTIAENPENWSRSGRLLSARPLYDDFTEGNGARLGLPPSRQTAGSGEGVTWNCATDANIANGLADCAPRWNGGGAFGPATDSALITNGLVGDVEWDVTDDVRSGTQRWLISKDNESLSGQITFYSIEGSLEDFEGLDVAPRLIIETYD